MAASPDAVELANRLRPAVYRLARLLRQQDDTGLAPALVSALGVVERDGPITLGDLAKQEQLSPPSITKVVVALEEQGLVERTRDDADRRVSRVRVTAKGRRQLEASRSRRTAWLATQIDALAPSERRLLHDALGVMEALSRGGRVPA
ncbi:MAG: MarR family transcriptional regulator [Acidimicrobiia bacterium]|nr:MAG: MarR family transcriptional regulator [Acidimicrobiia bacterium]